MKAIQPTTDNRASRREQLLFAMDDGADAPAPESQLQRMRRVLGIVGPAVQLASRYSFTPRAARDAAALAHRGNVAADRGPQ